MTWVKLDDNFFRHPKARAAGLAGRELFLVGLCYCATYLTDGEIPKSMASSLLAEAEVPRRALTRLLEIGWWEELADRYVVHDYLDFNPSRADVEGKRDGAQVRMLFARTGNDGSDEVHTSRTRTRPSKRSPASYDDDFEALWAEYPRKIAKKDAAKAYIARRRQGVAHEELVLATKHYAAVVVDKDATFVLHGATFFGPRERWKDYLELPAANGSKPGKFDSGAYE